MIAIVDYGIGNLYSISRSLEYIGCRSVITSDTELLESADGIILPGVGAFGDAMEKLTATGLIPVLNRQKEKKPFLGICLGMQLLFEESYEYGIHKGLGYLKGRIVPIGDYTENLKVPHMGWNSLHINRACKILKYISDGDFCYFVHSYFAKDCDSSVYAYTSYGTQLAAVVGNETVYGCQFHPEKSGAVGLNILKAFTELCQSEDDLNS